MARMKETPEDVAVKDRLWASTVSEISRFVDRMAEIHDIEDKEDQKQAKKDLAAALKLRGYPVSLINKIVSAKFKLIKAETKKKPDAKKIAELKAIPAGVLMSYRNRIGLLQGGRR